MKNKLSATNSKSYKIKPIVNHNRKLTPVE